MPGEVKDMEWRCVEARPIDKRTGESMTVATLTNAAAGSIVVIAERPLADMFDVGGIYRIEFTPVG